MAQGTVKWFNTQKGYGFINPDDGDNDVFVHITAVQNSGLNGLNEGQKVTYDLEEQRNGKMAAVGLGFVVVLSVNRQDQDRLRPFFHYAALQDHR